MRETTEPGGDPAGLRQRRLMASTRIGFLLTILFLAAFYTYVAFTGLGYLSSAGRLGPGFMPRIIGVSLIAMCVLSLYLDMRRFPGEEALSPGWRSAAVLALLTAVFVGLIEIAGALLSMIVFMGAALWILNRGRPLQNALIAVLLPVAVYVVFTVWLRASLPRGILPLPF